MVILNKNFIRIGRFLGLHALKLILLLSVIIIGIINPSFRQLANFQNILLQSSFVGVGAAGMTLLMINGSIDLSVAGLLGLSAILLGKILPVVGTIPAIIIVAISGAVLGSLNGFVVNKLRVSAFISTLGMGYIYLGLAYLWFAGKVIIIEDKRLLILGAGNVANIPIALILMAVIYIISYCVLRFTYYGRYVRSVGSNELASKLIGLPINKIRIYTFSITGLCTAIAGILLAGMISMANPLMATGFELNVIIIGKT